MNIVVVGGGLAAASAVEELRGRDYTGDITLLCGEQHLPYDRPPLSKGLLLGTATPESVTLKDAAWYADQQVDVRLGNRVDVLDLSRQRVHAAGTPVPFDRLLLATGSVPRRLPLDDTGVHYLRTVEDALAVRARLAGRVLVIGAGWIGLEVAAAASLAGAEVTVVEGTDHPLGGVLGPLAGVLLRVHREHGVDVRLGTALVSLAPHPEDGRTTAVLSDGAQIVADVVVAGIGAFPDDSLAAAAGLPVDNGVLVDGWLRTADPAVYAAGDVARHDHPLLQRRLRVEHWDTALHQGRWAARTMLGDDAPYTRLPYFFSDQYDLGLEYLGSVGPDGYDDLVVRGDPAGTVFTAVWIKGGMVVAGLHLNDWDAIDALRPLVGFPAPAGIKDSTIPLAKLVR